MWELNYKWLAYMSFALFSMKEEIPVLSRPRRFFFFCLLLKNANSANSLLIPMQIYLHNLHYFLFTGCWHFSKCELLKLEGIFLNFECHVARICALEAINHTGHRNNCQNLITRSKYVTSTVLLENHLWLNQYFCPHIWLRKQIL